MKKLNIMQMVASYRRRVQYYQWKFDTLKMKIEDMNACIRTIEKCVVSEAHSIPSSHNNRSECDLLLFYFYFPPKGHQRDSALATTKARRSHRRHRPTDGTKQKQSAAAACKHGKFLVSTHVVCAIMLNNEQR